MEKTDYIYRNIARITLEAATPLLVGSGKGDLVTDALAVKDINGLPYIPATSIAGVLQHALKMDKEAKKLLFGFQDKKDGQGSQVIFTDAVMIGKDGVALDGIQDIPWEEPLYAAYKDLPIRQHVRIGDKGTAEKYGKFDNEVVYQGTRFVFEIEQVADRQNAEAFRQIVEQLFDETLRIGSGTRKGYGKVKVTACTWAFLDLTRPDDLKDYLNKQASLAKPWSRFKPLEHTGNGMDKEEWVKYELRLQPRDFFLIGSGMGDEEADNTPMEERVVVWEDGKPHLSEKPQVLIPGSSVKGALAHRTAYNYNKLTKRFIGNEEAKTGHDNKAVAGIFGKADGNNITRGHLLIGDIIEGDIDDKLFYHIQIDAFTGGTIDGALFQEKSVKGMGRSYTLEIFVNRAAFADDSEGNMQKAFEQSLEQLCHGMLPLGGATSRGNGFFEGKLFINGEEQ